MNTPIATSRTPDPPLEVAVIDDAVSTMGRPRPPRLTHALAVALDHLPPKFLASSGLGTTLSGLATAGLLPAFRIAHRLRRQLQWRNHLMQRVSDWLRLNVGEREGEETVPAPSQRAERILIGVSVVCALLAAIAGGWQVVHEPTSVWRLWYVDPFRSDSVSLPQIAFLGSIGLSYLLLWVAVNVHLTHGRRWLARVADGFAPSSQRRSPVPKWEWGLRLVPVVAGGVLAWIGLLWALPMLLVAAAQRRSLLVHDRRLLQQVGAVVAERAAVRRPVEAAPPSSGRWRACPYEDCRAPVAQDAKFCPRCGRELQRIAVE